MSVAVPAPPVFAFLDARFWWTTGAMMAALLLGAYVIWAFRKWQRSGASHISANEQLSHYRTLLEKGEITEQEFNQLKGVLGGEIRSSLGMPVKLPPRPPDAAPPQEGIKPP